MSANSQNIHVKGPHVIAVSMPEPEQNILLSSLHGDKFFFDFSLKEIAIAKNGNDLRFSFNNGGAISLQDFFSSDANDLPRLSFSDVGELAAADFIKSNSLDIITAANEPEAPFTGGVGVYNAESPSLIDGVLRLGALGSFPWGETSNNANTASSTLSSVSNSITDSGNNDTLGSDVAGSDDETSDSETSDSEIAESDTSDSEASDSESSDNESSDNESEASDSDISESDSGTIAESDSDSSDADSDTSDTDSDSDVSDSDNVVSESDTSDSEPSESDGDSLAKTGVDDDVITLVNATQLYANTIYGDSASVSGKWTGGEGDQEYTDTGASSGKIYLGGKSTADATYYGNDIITLQSAYVNANTIFGGQGDDWVILEGASDETSTYAYANTIYGDEHTITATMAAGDDRILIDGDSRGNTIYGDGRIASSSAVLGNDTVIITGDSQGESYYGDVYDAYSGSIMGDDIFHVYGTSIGSSLYGDAYYLRENTVGGNDIIQIDGSSSGESIYGDSYYMYSGAQGGDDIIYIGGDATGNSIYGDAYNLASNVQTGSDAITIAGDLVGSGTSSTSTRVSGDVYSGSSYSIFGDDIITVKGNMTNASIHGDAYSSGANSQYGNDTIIIEGTVTNGVIVGDSYTSGGSNASFGDDYIEVGTFVSGGIYGDTHDSISSTSTGGNDTIVIHNLEGSGAKVVDGGAGTDLFIYDNADGHTISLSNSGTVSIDGSSSYNNTTITNFEGIGGGSGNDTISGNDYDNIIIGGLGSDTLTGGGGADTFVWRISDLDNSVDFITDFSFEENDALYIEGLFDSNGSVNSTYSINGDIDESGYLVISVSYGEISQDIVVNIDGGLSVDNTIYSTFNDFIDAYNVSDMQADMMAALVQQMLTNTM